MRRFVFVVGSIDIEGFGEVLVLGMKEEIGVRIGDVD